MSTDENGAQISQSCRHTMGQNYMGSLLSKTLAIYECVKCFLLVERCLKLMQLYKDHATCTLQNGQTVEFWHDEWWGTPFLQQWP